MSARDEADAINAIRSSGKCEVVELTAEDRSALKRALQPVHRQMADRIGRELLDSIYLATGSDQKQSNAEPWLPVAVR
jgi:C4-dicarboxylate-binding protein DctP